MSTFGGPGGRTTFSKPTPPERGSFPLDHEAECQPIMKQYLRCIKSKRGVNDEECRQLSKGYLQCRMDRNLMAPDSMRNLGFQDHDQDQDQEHVQDQTQTQTQTHARDDALQGKKIITAERDYDVAVQTRANDNKNNKNKPSNP